MGDGLQGASAVPSRRMELRVKLPFTGPGRHLVTTSLAWHR